MGWQKSGRIMGSNTRIPSWKDREKQVLFWKGRSTIKSTKEPWNWRDRDLQAQATTPPSTSTTWVGPTAQPSRNSFSAVAQAGQKHRFQKSRNSLWNLAKERNFWKNSNWKYKIEKAPKSTLSQKKMDIWFPDPMDSKRDQTTVAFSISSSAKTTLAP